MLDEHPSAGELVGAVADFLDTEVYPALTGRIAFHTKVSVNALRMVERELSASTAGEVCPLRELTAAAGDLAELKSLVGPTIPSGGLSIEDAGLLGHPIRSVL